ncbi:MAG: hypothetical protein NZ659_14250, partial [Acidimicrobiales bacterium]|nr:hypothetical protein [Acidimicrobiales bacterium]
MSALLPNLLHFGRLLYRLGLDVPAGRMREVAESLAYINVGQRDEFYHTLRTLLVHRMEDLSLFDDAFRIFWRPPPRDRTEIDLRTMGETRQSDKPEHHSEQPTSADGDRPSNSRAYQIERVATLSYSQHEGLRTKDFERFSEE